MVTASNVLTLVLTAKLKLNDVTKEELAGIVVEALRRETDHARQRYEHFLQECQAFEAKYNLSSDEFLTQFENGTLGDGADFFHWYASKEGRDHLQRHYQILRSISVEHP